MLIHVGNISVRESLSDGNQMNASEIANLIERRINETDGISVTDDPIEAVRRIYQGLNCYVVSCTINLHAIAIY